ncbi:unnamed protein product [marine sediment metagenome]|uniref:Uncharacterized protein n=1 Tax=marine sediment metagenome TaxID=412755 RepID=X1KBE8_9ZZZZ
MIEGVLKDETPEVMVVATLRGDVRIPGSSEADVSLNRIYILGQGDRVCQTC